MIFSIYVFLTRIGLNSISKMWIFYRYRALKPRNLVSNDQLKQLVIFFKYYLGI